MNWQVGDRAIVDCAASTMHGQTVTIAGPLAPWASLSECPFIGHEVTPSPDSEAAAFEPHELIPIPDDDEASWEKIEALTGWKIKELVPVEV